MDPALAHTLKRPDLHIDEVAIATPSGIKIIFWEWVIWIGFCFLVVPFKFVKNKNGKYDVVLDSVQCLISTWLIQVCMSYKVAKWTVVVGSIFFRDSNDWSEIGLDYLQGVFIFMYAQKMVLFKGPWLKMFIKYNDWVEKVTKGEEARRISSVFVATRDSQDYWEGLNMVFEHSPEAERKAKRCILS